jgi:Wzt C-terminal domain
VRVRARYARPVEESSLGVALRDGSGTLLFATSTDLEEVPLGARSGDEVVTVDFTFGVPLRPGGYGVEATVSGDGGRLLGQSEKGASFEVVAEVHQVRGLVRLPTTVEVHDRDPEEQGQAT